MNNHWLSIAIGILSVYDSLATGGAKAEADKILAIAVSALTQPASPTA